MAITRKLVAQDDNDDNQWLKVDHNSRYIVNDMDDWQFLFGPNSSLSTGTQVLKIAAEFNKDTFDTIRFTSYLYNSATGSVDSAGSATYNVYLVTTPDWTEQLVTSFSGTQLTNQHFFANINTSSLTPVDFFGGDTIMIEAIMVRLGVTYRDRLYVNHLGIYDNAFRLRRDLDFLDITKQDI